MIIFSHLVYTQEILLSNGEEKCKNPDTEKLNFFKVVRIAQFLPERDYVTFGSLLSQIRLSDVCRLSSVTLVHPTQGVEPFGKISSPLCTLAIL